ncbi:MAG: DUF1918 domain-containing protein [Actinomycetota bacterium]
MSSTHGARITVDSEKVGAPQRHGEVLEIISSGISVRYRVRWDDGRQTMFRPAAGSVVMLSDEPRRAESPVRESKEGKAAKAGTAPTKKGKQKKRKKK